MTTTAAQTSKTAAYLRTRVMSASPEELRLMLLEGAIKFLNQGREGLERKSFEAMFDGFSRCREIVLELLTTIREDVDAELAKNAKALYAYIYKTLVEGAHEKDLSKIDTVAKLLEFERETWLMLMDRLAQDRGVRPDPVQKAISVEG